MFNQPAISYMVHTMGLNSDLEPCFDPSRRDHYDLFNVRYLMSYDPGFLPDFATDRTQLPGIYAAAVDTPGYIGIPLTAGEHLVELRYRSPLWTTVLFWFGLSLIPLVYAGERSGFNGRAAL